MVSVSGVDLKASSPERPVFLPSGSVEKVVSSTRQKRSHFWMQSRRY